MAKKIKLTTENHVDYTVLAISSVFKMHRLCHVFNSNLNLNFIRLEDYKLETKLGEMQFPLCKSNSNDFDVLYYLLKNKSMQGFLLPEIKATDYILIAKGRECEEAANAMQTEILKIADIQAGFLLDSNNLKNIHNLLFDNDYQE